MNIMMKRVFNVALLTIVCLMCKASSNVLDSLDYYLAKADKYDKHKEVCIELLRKEASRVHDDKSLYDIYCRLFNAYSSYKYDSAAVYAERSLNVAHRLSSKDRVVMAECNKAFCLLSAGLYKESFDAVNAIDTTYMGDEARKKYFLTKWRLLADIADYNHGYPYQKEYIAEAHQLAETLKTLFDVNTIEWKYIEGLQQQKENKYYECANTFKQLINEPALDMHMRAIITSILGWIYQSQGDEEQGLRYLAEAAICDIKSSTKETTALREVGVLVFKSGDFNRATAYMQKALDDANFYDARQRKIEIGSILPIIQQDRYNVIRKQRNIYIFAVGVVLFLLLCLSVSLYMLHRQMHKLQKTRDIINERNREIEHHLRELQEANNIKTEYIGKSFFINANYINKVEKLYRDIDHKISAHQYDNLRRSLKESILMAERKSMYTDFDETFLTLFPNFIERYNILFKEADRKVPSMRKSLTIEMRIFALIRLGINDANRIAQFLNYSVNTINTYKTRVKNKSIVNNDEFEQKIMEI